MTRTNSTANKAVQLKATLADVVAFYNRGGIKNPWLSSDVRPLNLTAEEQKDMVAFLQSLTGEIDPDVSKPPKLPQ
jgi:cytochrome c peroxidase